MPTTPFSIEVLYNSIPFLDRDLGAEVLSGFYQDQESLASVVNANIQALTPVLTGALRSSEKYDINHDPSDPTLIRFYADKAEQLAQWNRVYVSYQEGAPLGQSTYTNAAHQMYYSQATYESIDELLEWGFGSLYNSVNTYTLEFHRT